MASEKRLIDMGKFLDVLRRYLNSSHVRERGPVCCGMRIAIRSCIELLESQKPVDAVEVVHGEWDARREIKRYRGENIPVIQCSECKCYFCDIINNHHYMYHYCPNCGAKMDGERKDNGSPQKMLLQLRK